MPMTAFTPQRHGFHFSNSFVNPIVTIPGLGTISTYGLCGGMSMAALDYYHSATPVPTHVPSDFPGGSVPAVGSALYQYLFDRQLASFNPFTHPSVVKFVTQRLPVGRTAFEVSVQDEWPLVVASLNAGTPVPLGLIAPSSDPTQSHQVVAIGYEPFPQQLFLYDCNHPDTVVALRLDAAAQMITESTGERWDGFFLEQYVQAATTYVDMRLSYGIGTNPVAPDADVLGDVVEAGFRVMNFGEYPAHVAGLDVSLHGPGGEDLDSAYAVDGTPVTLAVGAERLYLATAAPFGTSSGTYEFIAYYQSSLGEWFPVPSGTAGTATTTTLDAH